MELFTVKIECENAAFKDPEGDDHADYRAQEVARLLRETAKKIEAGYTSVYLVDYNGNRVGFAEFKEAA